MDGTVYAKPSERPPPLLSPALRSLEPVPLAVSSAETLDVSAFPWNLLLEGGNQVRPIKLCDINDALPRPLGGGGWRALWAAADRSRPATLAAVSFPGTELRPPEPPTLSSWA